MTVPFKTHELLDGENVSHGFFGRVGGVSTNQYESLNVGFGSNDKYNHVLKNREIVSSVLSQKGVKIVSLTQIHSAKIVTVTQNKTYQDHKADGIVTNTPNLAISIMSADCGPILFSDQNANIIGCCHAGWRGAFSGVISNTIKAMEKIGANKRNINAVLGPCISLNNYEVGIEFYDKFIKQNKSNLIFFKKQKNGKIYFDLKKYILENLQSNNLNQIDLIPDCTYELSDKYFSYRYNTHNGIKDYGRNISSIMLNS